MLQDREAGGHLPHGAVQECLLDQVVVYRSGQKPHNLRVTCERPRGGKSEVGMREAIRGESKGKCGPRTEPGGQARSGHHAQAGPGPGCEQRQGWDPAVLEFKP